MTSPHGGTALEVEHPIPHAYWVCPCRVLAGDYPCSVDLFRHARPAEAAAEYAKLRVRWLLEIGVSAFVDLTENGELESYYAVLIEEASRLGAAPVYQRWPIRDGGTPTIAMMTEILDAIDASVETGKTVYLHCMAGLGRTGVVVGCYLVRHGMSGEDALEEIWRLRRNLPNGSAKSPYTDSQREMVLTRTE